MFVCVSFIKYVRYSMPYIFLNVQRLRKVYYTRKKKQQQQTHLDQKL